MTDSENTLTIIYEGENKKVPIKSTFDEIEKEFIQKFKLSENYHYYLYFKSDDDNLILNEDSFQEFIDSNTKELFAEKEIKDDNKENDLNNQNVDSEFDLFFQELEKEINKINKKKENKLNTLIKSNECEVEYNKTNNKRNSNDNEQNKLVEELKLKVDNLIEENNKLKEIEKKYKENIQKKEQSKQIKLDYQKINVINLKYNMQERKKQIENHIEQLKNENIKLKNENKQLLEEYKNLKDKAKKLEDIENQNKTLDLLLKESKEREEKISKRYEDFRNRKNSRKFKNLKVDKFELNILQNKKIFSSYPSDINQSKIIKIKKNKKIKIINKISKEYKTKFSYSEKIKTDVYKSIRDIEDMYKSRLKLANDDNYLGNISKSQNFNQRKNN